MKERDFAALIERLEPVARAHPDSYRRKVIALAMLGYAYLGLITSLLLGLFALAILSLLFLKAWAIKLIIPIGAFIWLIAKAMWIKFDPPTGIRVTPADSPKLFEMIEGLRTKLKALHVHQVLITDDFNASIQQCPRLGILGWHRNYLILGLPLMKALTPQQLEAVLAHEFGHLAGGHGKLSNWIYRLRMSWYRLLDALTAQQSSGTFLFERFFKWYVPYFSAYSFPLARQNEFEADAVSARLTSPENAAGALLRVHEAGALLDNRFWPEITGRIETEPRPSFTPYSRMTQHFEQNLGKDGASGWLEHALALNTSHADTHPALKDRLEALQVSPQIAPHQGAGRADELLGTKLQDITEHLDQQWHQAVTPAWETRHKEIEAAKSDLAALQSMVDGGQEMDADSELRYAQLVERFGGNADAALARFAQLAESYPDHAGIQFAHGMRLLQMGNDAGILPMQRAMELDASAYVPCCEVIRDFHWAQGNKEQAFNWQERAQAQQHELDKAYAERTNVRTTDKFEPNDLDAATVENLRTQLKTVPGVKKFYIVKKQLKNPTDRPLYLGGFIVRLAWWKPLREKHVAEVQQAILSSVLFPDETIIFSLQGDNSKFLGKFRWKRNARIV